MATSGHFSGTLIKLFVDTQLVGCQRDSNWESQFETIDATCKDNGGAKSVLPGQLSWTISMDGVMVYDPAGTNIGITDLMEKQLNKQEVSVAWTTGNVGDPIYTGMAYITAISESAPLNDVATYSITFTGNGPMTLDILDTIYPS